MQQIKPAKKTNYWPMLSLLMIVIIISVGYFVIYPDIGQLKELNKQISARTRESDAMQEKITALKGLQQEFSAKQNEVKLFDLAMPQNDGMPEIISSLDAMASETALSITSLAQKKSTKDNQSTSVDVSGEGSYKSFTLFLEDLEKNIRQSNITSISLSTGKIQLEEVTDAIKVTMNIDFFKVGSSSDTTNQPSTEVKE